MRAGRMTISTGTFAVVDVPTPSPGKDQVLIKVGAAGVCLSDVHFLSGILKPGYLEADSVTLGHEVAGTIDALGENVRDWHTGERVIVCAGVRNEKDQVTTLGFDYDGGFAEYTIADTETLVRIPDELPFEQACIIPDAVSTPWAAITQTAQIQSGESAAVFGIGGLGIHAVQLLKIVGAWPIIAIDPLEHARDRALSVGADYVFDPRDEEMSSKIKALTSGVNVCFDFAGSGAARIQALRLLAQGGSLVIVGLANEPIVIANDIAFAYKHCKVLGHYGSEPFHSQELVDLVRQGKLDLSGSVSEILPLEQVATAFEKLEKKIGNPVRIVIKP